MKNKRGISPLIATVLLVAIVIIIAVLIFFWYTDVLEKQQEKEQLTTELICTQKVEFELSNVDCSIDYNSNNDDAVIFKAENTGSRHIDKFKVIVKNSDDDVLATVQTGSGVRYPETEQLSIDILDNGIDYGLDIEIEVIPIIINEGKANECTQKSRTATINC